MKRLVHDHPSLLMACRMSREDFFCFVEGVENDIYFYSQLTNKVFKENELVAEFKTANDLESSGKSGGKQPLIKFYEFLYKNDALTSEFKGKKSTIIFLLDKDVDEYKIGLLRSKNVFYTEHYDVQNYLLLQGDIANSAASCASVTVDIISQSIGDQAEWLTDCLNKWKDWVKVCLFLSKQDISLGGYALSSKVNENEFGVVDQELLNRYKALALRKSGLDNATFDKLYSDICNEVDNLYLTGNANKVFKGKWYLYWLENYLKNIHKLKINPKHLACILSSNLDWSGDWTNSYTAKLKRVVKEHKKFLAQP